MLTDLLLAPVDLELLFCLPSPDISGTKGTRMIELTRWNGPVFSTANNDMDNNQQASETVLKSLAIKSVSSSLLSGNSAAGMGNCLEVEPEAQFEHICFTDGRLFRKPLLGMRGSK